jgi:hypothetical protein
MPGPQCNEGLSYYETGRKYETTTVKRPHRQARIYLGGILHDQGLIS